MNTYSDLQEKWLPIKGYRNYYEVSNLGRVRSLARVIKRKDGILRTNASRIKKQTLNNAGYFITKLTNDRGSKTELVHRIVAGAFLENPENKPQVNHKDAKKTNNKVSNLEWNTGYENTHHAINMGLIPKFLGEKVSSSKLTSKQVKKIKYELQELKVSEIAKKFKVSERTIYSIRKGDYWSHI